MLFSVHTYIYIYTHMGASILIAKGQQICKKLIRQILQNIFLQGSGSRDLSRSIPLAKPLNFHFGSLQKLFGKPHSCKIRLFIRVFTHFLRPNFPPVWPVPIPGPYPPFLGIIHRYRPSIPPTSSSNFVIQEFL